MVIAVNSVPSENSLVYLCQNKPAVYDQLKYVLMSSPFYAIVEIGCLVVL